MLHATQPGKYLFGPAKMRFISRNLILILNRSELQEARKADTLPLQIQIPIPIPETYAKAVVCQVGRGQLVQLTSDANVLVLPSLNQTRSVCLTG